jgi:hypothetical protein
MSHPSRLGDYLSVLLWIRQGRVAERFPNRRPARKSIFAKNNEGEAKATDKKKLFAQKGYSPDQHQGRHPP